MIKKVVLYKKYFIKFYKNQDKKTQRKIQYVLDLIRHENRVPKKFFKYLEGSDGIYEIRIRTTFKNIRILCFHDEGQLVILVNCFIKKATKTPKWEIELAEKLKREYLILDKLNYRNK